MHDMRPSINGETILERRSRRLVENRSLAVSGLDTHPAPSNRQTEIRQLFTWAQVPIRMDYAISAGTSVCLACNCWSQTLCVVFIPAITIYFTPSSLQYLSIHTSLSCHSCEASTFRVKAPTMLFSSLLLLLAWQVGLSVCVGEDGELWEMLRFGGATQPWIVNPTWYRWVQPGSANPRDEDRPTWQDAVRMARDHYSWVMRKGENKRGTNNNAVVVS